MEAEDSVKMNTLEDTTQIYRGQDGPPTSMNTVSPENFSQVIFPEIKKSYPPNTDIQCNFHKRKDFWSGTKDWVGIFKVGWQTTKEYYTWVSASSVENYVLFKAYYLPKDDEYYQFCYVDQSGDVRGVSTPFQVIEDENEIVIVATQEEMENISEENRLLKEKIQNLTEQIQTLMDNLYCATEKNNRLEQENMEKNQTLQDQLNTATEKNNTLEKENMEKHQILGEKIQTLQDQLNTATEKNNTLEKENKHMQIQVKNLEAEKETMKRSNQELELQKNKLQDSQIGLNQKIMDLEKIEPEMKRLQSEKEAKQQAVENLSGLLENCKKEVIKQNNKLEVLTSNLEKEKRLTEELQHSLQEEKTKQVDLESNFKKTTAMLRRAEDNIPKLQQQLALQQAENASKDEKMKKLHSDIADLESNLTRLHNSYEEQLRIIENEKKKNGDLEEQLDRQRETFLESENKIRDLIIDLRCAQESRTTMEQMLAKEQNERRKNEEIITLLNGTIELREEEMIDLKELYERKRAEVDELNSQLIQAQIAAQAPLSFSSAPQTQGMAYGNPYQDISPRISAQNESLLHLETGREERHEETKPPIVRKCPMCSVVLQDANDQVYEDHVLCHTFENIDNIENIENIDMLI